MNKLIKHIKQNNNVLYGPISKEQSDRLLELLYNFIYYYNKFYINNAYVKQNLKDFVQLVFDSFKKNRDKLYFDAIVDKYQAQIIIRNKEDGHFFLFKWFNKYDDYLFEVGNNKDKMFLINYKFNTKSSLMNSIYEVCVWILEDWELI